jgi:hypothetical protein
VEVREQRREGAREGRKGWVCSRRLYGVACVSVGTARWDRGRGGRARVRLVVLAAALLLLACSPTCACGSRSLVTADGAWVGCVSAPARRAQAMPGDANTKRTRLVAAGSDRRRGRARTTGPGHPHGHWTNAHDSVSRTQPQRVEISSFSWVHAGVQPRGRSNGGAGPGLDREPSETLTWMTVTRDWSAFRWLGGRSTGGEEAAVPHCHQPHSRRFAGSACTAQADRSIDQQQLQALSPLSPTHDESTTWQQRKPRAGRVASETGCRALHAPTASSSTSHAVSPRRQRG